MAYTEFHLWGEAEKIIRETYARSFRDTRKVLLLKTGDTFTDDHCIIILYTRLYPSRAWWHTPVISTTQEDCKFKASLDNMRPLLKNKKGLEI